MSGFLNSASGGSSGSFGSLLDTDLDTVVLLVPSLERGGLDLNNRVLNQGLGTNKLVVGGVVYDIQDTGLVGGHCTLHMKDKRYRRNNLS